MAITLNNGNINNTNTTNTTNTTNATGSGNGISLVKGQTLSLTKKDPNLNNLLVGLGWDTNSYHGGAVFDLDVSVFMLGADGKVPSNDEFIFFNQLKHKSGAVEHTGDNRTGVGDGDDEVIKVNLSQVPTYVEKIVFVVTIFDTGHEEQTFGNVENSYIRIVNQDTNSEEVRYDLCEDFSVENAINVGELYRYNGEWKFRAIGSGFNNSLKGFTDKYGVVLGK